MNKPEVAVAEWERWRAGKRSAHQSRRSTRTRHGFWLRRLLWPVKSDGSADVPVIAAGGQAQGHGGSQNDPVSGRTTSDLSAAHSSNEQSQDDRFVTPSVTATVTGTSTTINGHDEPQTDGSSDRPTDTPAAANVTGEPGSDTADGDLETDRFTDAAEDQPVTATLSVKLVWHTRRTNSFEAEQGETGPPRQ